MDTLFSRTRRLMGTDIEILLPRDEYFYEELAEQMTESVFQKFAKLEDIFSRFRSESELSKLNIARSASVSDDFWILLSFALSLAKETNGVFNPLINLSTLGYSKDFWSKNFEATHEEQNLHFQNIFLEEKTHAVTLPKNAKLDLGGCAKGYAVDTASKVLSPLFPNFLVNAGGDLYASGNYFGEPWAVGIANPEDETENLAVLSVSNSAIATSGSYRRKWKMGEEEHHHILNGQNNTNPKTLVKSVTVEAKTALEADSYATVAFILGKEEGQKFLKEHGAKGWFW